MTKLWVVCGAGQGVGKTHLAQSLCQSLPNAAYAKYGCGDPQAEKAKNFFQTEQGLADFIAAHTDSHSHLVVESNTMARNGQGDLVLFIEPLPAHTNVRTDVDQLRKNSHIRIGEEFGLVDWQPVLAENIDDPAIIRDVEKILMAQRERHTEIGLAVRSKLWFIKDDLRVFGPGLARILEGVEKRGTLRAAVVAVKISYRHAWNVIKDAEAHLGQKLLAPQVGGSGGGGSTLTPAGRELLRIYREVSMQVDAYADELFRTKLQEKWGSAEN